MSEIIPFESGNLPAYLKNVNVEDLNSDLAAANTGFPVISIKGKVFTIVRGGERTTMMNPKDPDSAATAIEVVLIKANKGLSKVYYAKGYDEKAENQKPDCFSNEGTKPDSSVDKPQSKSCATCPHNQWGSKIGDNGGKGKACQDSKRMAIAAPGLINDPYLIRVPPASIKALSEYGSGLAKRGVPYSAVVTKVGFVMEEATPKLTFKAVGLLPDAMFQEVQSAMDSEVVHSILGTVGTHTEADELPVIEAPAPVVEKPKAEAKPKPKAEPKPEPKPVAVTEPEVDLNLDDLNFDD
jgi:hypothetical protein